MRSQYDRYAEDAEVLARIGAKLASQTHEGPRTISAYLAEQAAAAWERDELEDLAEPESEAQRIARYAAADLALIGLAISEREVRERGGALVMDEPVVLHCYIAPEAIEDPSHQTALGAVCRRLGRETHQGEVGLVIDNECFAFRDFTEEPAP